MIKHVKIFIRKVVKIKRESIGLLYFIGDQWKSFTWRLYSNFLVQSQTAKINFLGRAVARAPISGFFPLSVILSLLAAREVGRITTGIKTVWSTSDTTRGQVRLPTWKTIYDRRRPLMEDNLWWKATFDGRRPLMEDNLWLTTTFDRGQRFHKM